MARWSTRTAWVAAVPLTVAVVASVIVAARHGHDKGGYSLNGKTAPIGSSSTAPYPSFSAAFAGAVNSADVHIVPASESALVTEESAVTAALAQVGPGSSALAAELVTLTNSQDANGVLAWAIETHPAGGYHAASYGPVGKPHPVPVMNFRVDFVDASTGKWLEGVEGYSPGLA